jgi:hypothetical protein
MRRRALREQPSQTVATRAPRVLLALYEWIGGYRVRPGHPSVTLIVLLAIAWPFAAHSRLSHGAAPTRSRSSCKHPAAAQHPQQHDNNRRAMPSTLGYASSDRW